MNFNDINGITIGGWKCAVCGQYCTSVHYCPGPQTYGNNTYSYPPKRTTEDEILETLKEILKRLPVSVPYVYPVITTPYWPPYVVTVTTGANTAGNFDTGR